MIISGLTYPVAADALNFAALPVVSSTLDVAVPAGKVWLVASAMASIGPTTSTPVQQASLELGILDPTLVRRGQIVNITATQLASNNNPFHSNNAVGVEMLPIPENWVLRRTITVIGATNVFYINLGVVIIEQSIAAYNAGQVDGIILTSQLTALAQQIVGGLRRQDAAGLL